MKYDYKNFVIPAAAELKQQLGVERYRIAYEAGTEPPFENAYFDNKAAGIYVDAVSKYPLFSSLDKYDSGTGWPSFTKPMAGVELIEKADTSFGYNRVEVISPSSMAHLGHVFDDGPIAAGGKRYCMNSAVLEFIPVADLAAYGYAEFSALFAD